MNLQAHPPCIALSIVGILVMALVIIGALIIVAIKQSTSLASDDGSQEKSVLDLGRTFTNVENNGS